MTSLLPTRRQSIRIQHALHYPWTHFLLLSRPEILHLRNRASVSPPLCNLMPNMYIHLVISDDCQISYFLAINIGLSNSEFALGDRSATTKNSWKKEFVACYYYGVLSWSLISVGCSCVDDNSNACISPHSFYIRTSITHKPGTEERKHLLCWE